MKPVLLLIDVQCNMLLPPEPVPGAQEVSAAGTKILDLEEVAMP
ncbi:hypothetical protein ACQPYK_46100 [Streptosporangium sp. CA-135522]